MPPRAVVWRLNERGFTEVTPSPLRWAGLCRRGVEPLRRARAPVRGCARRPRSSGASASTTGSRDAGRIVRRAPGYGWTEEDEVPRRPIREAERIVPPADIPFPAGAGPAGASRTSEAPGLRSAARSGTAHRDDPPAGACRPEPDGPESRCSRGSEARPKADAPRKVVRLNPAPKRRLPPAVTPDAPKLSDVPAVAAPA